MSADQGNDVSRRATSALSLDDLEAAQALEGLRAGTELPSILGVVAHSAHYIRREQIMVAHQESIPTMLWPPKSIPRCTLHQPLSQLETPSPCYHS